MTSVLASHHLTDIRADAVKTLWDTCVIQVLTTARDDLGQPIKTYTDGSAISCGVYLRSASDVSAAFGTAAQVDATLRLPLTTTLTKDDRVKVTHRQGIALTTAEIFEVVGEPRRGLSLLVADLKRST